MEKVEVNCYVHTFPFVDGAQELHGLSDAGVCLGVDAVQQLVEMGEGAGDLV